MPSAGKECLDRVESKRPVVGRIAVVDLEAVVGKFSVAVVDIGLFGLVVLGRMVVVVVDGGSFPC